eukprot:GHVS01007561.1.p1 GENE.GHVS01007561.1~~GHVS01007561.1.p1  ORF type:complete len:241 (+),score=42.99 GHVS01007561.1:246-968(+)
MNYGSVPSPPPPPSEFRQYQAAISSDAFVTTSRFPSRTAPPPPPHRLPEPIPSTPRRGWKSPTGSQADRTREAYPGERAELAHLYECHECFLLHDMDKDGKVNAEEFGKMARCLGQLWTATELKRIKAVMREQNLQQQKSGGEATSGEEVVWFDMGMFMEFLSWNRDRKADRSKLHRAFDVLDRRKHRLVLVKDLVHTMKSVGECMPEEQLKHLLALEGCEHKQSLNEKHFIDVVAQGLL